MDVVSLFSGAGGLDLGFERAGFNVIWANEYDKEIWETFENNFLHTILDKRSITDIPIDEIPDCDGIIGGPPCQSWSEAGALRGIADHRGQLFFNFIHLLQEKQPKFFLAENVSGMLASRHADALDFIKQEFIDAGYKLSFRLLNAADYKVPQERKRIFFIGYRNDLGRVFEFPPPLLTRLTLRDAIEDLCDTVEAANDKNHSNQNLTIPNHEYMNGSFSTIYMSRNRVRNWDEQSFTIQAGGRHAPIHPQAPKMIKVETDKQVFVPGQEDDYRRLSVRECARIQTFPDDFIFKYKTVAAGYKMIGNAVPVNLATILAKQIYNDLHGIDG